MSATKVRLDSTLIASFYVVSDGVCADKIFFSYDEAEAYAEYRTNQITNPITIAESTRRVITIIK